MTNSEDCDSNDKVGIEIMIMKDDEIVVEGIVPLVLLLPLQLFNIQIIQNSNILDMLCQIY